MNVHVGTSGYSYPEWKGNFYPAKRLADAGEMVASLLDAAGTLKKWLGPLGLRPKPGATASCSSSTRTRAGDRNWPRACSTYSRRVQVRRCGVEAFPVGRAESARPDGSATPGGGPRRLGPTYENLGNLTRAGRVAGWLRKTKSRTT